MALQATIDQEIKKAMLGKDNVSLRGLRAIKAALLLANTEKGASEALSEEAEVKVLQKLAKQRKESAEIYKTQNREDLYQIEMEELEVIERFLPQQMDEAALTQALQDIITASGASSPKDMGKVMGLASQQLAGKADGKLISTIVRQLLSNA
jgi:uncharacterized protein YqeY